MRQLFVAGNWKMNGTIQLIDEMAAALTKSTTVGTGIEVCVFPPYHLLQLATEKLHTSNVLVGAQNCHWMSSGAYTGELSATMVKGLGVTHVIVGHSEVRRDQADTDERVALRAHAAVQAGLIPIVCFGEQLIDRNEGRHMQVLIGQLNAIMSACPKPLANFLLAYEPVWAIGTGLTASVAQIAEVHAAVQSHLESEFSMKVPLLYGGSVTDLNALEILSCQYVDGLLVGGASLKPSLFSNIINAAREVLNN